MQVVSCSGGYHRLLHTMPRNGSSSTLPNALILFPGKHVGDSAGLKFTFLVNITPLRRRNLPPPPPPPQPQGRTTAAVLTELSISLSVVCLLVGGVYRMSSWCVVGRHGKGTVYICVLLFPPFHTFPSFLHTFLSFHIRVLPPTHASYLSVFLTLPPYFFSPLDPSLLHLLLLLLPPSHLSIPCSAQHVLPFLPFAYSITRSTNISPSTSLPRVPLCLFHPCVHPSSSRETRWSQILHFFLPGCLSDFVCVEKNCGKLKIDGVAPLCAKKQKGLLP